MGGDADDDGDDAEWDCTCQDEDDQDDDPDIDGYSDDYGSSDGDSVEEMPAESLPMAQRYFLF